MLLDVARICIESTDPFLYDACCAYLHALNDLNPCTVVAMRPSEPEFSLVCMARERGTVKYGDHLVEYEVIGGGASPGEPRASDGKPFRQLILTMRTMCKKDVLLDLVHGAVLHHQSRTRAPRGQSGEGVMRYVWDDDAACWGSGKLLPHRALGTLFLPGRDADDLLRDLGSYLKVGTRKRHDELHVAPVRLYVLWGERGSGKTSLVHCLASETGHDLAVMNFGKHTVDADVAQALRTLPPDAFLCIEDIDRDVSFPSLLAALDGAYDSAPLKVFVTTSSLDRLGRALRRRVDYALEFGCATETQCRQLFSAFYPDRAGFGELWAAIGSHKFGMSVMQKYLVRTMHAEDPLASLPLFESLLRLWVEPRTEYMEP